VYSRIESLTDCKALLAEFDTAMDYYKGETRSERRKMNMAYANAADERMKDIGCP